MVHRTLFLICLLSGWSVEGLATTFQEIKCTVALAYDYYPAYMPELTKTCIKVGQPTEQCTHFSIHARAFPKKYAYTDRHAAIDRVNGILEFKPVALSSFEEETPEGHARRWMLHFLGNTGKFKPRFLFLDGAFKPISPMMELTEKERRLKRHTLLTKIWPETWQCTVIHPKKHTAFK